MAHKKPRYVAPTARCANCYNRFHRAPACPYRPEAERFRTLPSQFFNAQRDKVHLRIQICPHANHEHDESLRQYAHTYCNGPDSPRDLICVADSFFFLPEGIRKGLLAHEVGHLIAGYSGSEAKADKEGAKLYGRINYLDGEWGQHLQQLSQRYWKWFDLITEITWLDADATEDPEPASPRAWWMICTRCDWTNRRYAASAAVRQRRPCPRCGSPVKQDRPVNVG